MVSFLLDYTFYKHTLNKLQDRAVKGQQPLGNGSAMNPPRYANDAFANAKDTMHELSGITLEQGKAIIGVPYRCL